MDLLKSALKSRKYATAICTALLVGLNDALKLGLREDTIQNIVLILSAWIVGESAIDAAGAMGTQRATIEAATPSTTPPAPH